MIVANHISGSETIPKTGVSCKSLFKMNSISLMSFQVSNVDEERDGQVTVGCRGMKCSCNEFQVTPCNGECGDDHCNLVGCGVKCHHIKYVTSIFKKQIEALYGIK